MRLVSLAVLPLTCCLAPGLQAQDEQLTADTLPRFISSYDQTLQQVDSAFAEILNQKLPLLDDSGKPLLHRNVEDRHQNKRQTQQQIRRIIPRLNSRARRQLDPGPRTQSLGHRAPAADRGELSPSPLRRRG